MSQNAQGGNNQSNYKPGQTFSGQQGQAYSNNAHLNPQYSTNQSSYQGNTGISSQQNNVRTSNIGGRKKVQVIEEVPVYVEREVEVPYEVIIERPIENIIENRYYIDKEVEVPIKRVTEIEVEKIIEQKKYIPIEKRVEIETIYERPYETIVEVPIEIIREVNVPVERTVNVNKERTILRPHRSEVRENIIHVDKEIKVDKIVERSVQVEVPVYVEREVERIVDVAEHIYRDVPYDVPRIVEVKRNVPYNKLVEVPTERFVDKEIMVDRIVERPYYVEKIIEKKREVPVQRIVEIPIYVDKIVERPVEKRVEVPYTVQKQVERIIQKNVNVPLITTKQVDVLVERIIEEPMEIIEEIEVPYEKIVERIVEVPVYIEKEIYEDIEIEVPVERIVEVPVYIDKEIEVEIIKEKFIEVPFERIVDKIVEIERVIEKPIYNQKVIEKPIEKIVERRVEVPIEKYVEVPKYREVEKIIDVERRIQKPVIVERKSHRSMRKSVNRSNISNSQKTTYTTMGETLSKYKIENLKLSLEIRAFETQITDYRKISRNPDQLSQENFSLKQKISQLEVTLSNLKTENITLESQTTTIKETQQVEIYSEAEIRKIEQDIRSLEEKNKALYQILGNIGVTTDVSVSQIRQPTFEEIKTVSSSRNVGPNITTYDSSSRVNRVSVHGNTNLTTSTYEQGRVGRSITPNKRVSEYNRASMIEGEPLKISTTITELPPRNTTNYTTVTTQSNNGVSRTSGYNQNARVVSGTSYLPVQKVENVRTYSNYSGSGRLIEAPVTYTNGQRVEYRVSGGNNDVKIDYNTHLKDSGHHAYTNIIGDRVGDYNNSGLFTNVQTHSRVEYPVITKVDNYTNGNAKVTQYETKSGYQTTTVSQTQSKPMTSIGLNSDIHHNNLLSNSQNYGSSSGQNIQTNFSSNPYLKTYEDAVKKY
jgi:hypothetical protein